MTMDYSPWSEREIWLFLKGAKSQKPKRPYPPKIGAHAYLIILKVFVCFSMFTYPSLFTYCFESLNACHKYSIMSSSIHLPQEHMTINSAPGIQEPINLITFTSLVFPDCGMLYLPPTSYLCPMSKLLLHPSLLSSSTIFMITSTHHSPAHFTINVPVALSTLSFTHSDDYHYLSSNFIH